MPIRHLKPTLLSIIALLTLLISLVVEANHAAQSPDGQQLTSIRARLHAQLNSNVYLLDALHELVRRYPLIEQGQFETAAREMFASHDELVAIQLARDTRVSHVYPRTGNQQMLGHNLLTDPERNQRVKATLSTRTTTLAGPYQLRQGGMGFVLRQPIYRDRAREDYWGLATLVIDWQRLTQAIGLTELNNNTQFALRSLETERSTIVLGEPSLFQSKNSEQQTLTLFNNRLQISLQTGTAQYWLPSHLIMIGLLSVAGLLLIGIALLLYRRNHWLTPATLASAFVMLCMAGLTAYCQSQQRNHQLQSYEAANQVRQLLYQRLTDNQNYLSLLSEEHNLGQLSLKKFSERGGHFVADHPELMNLNWVSADLVIQEVTPRKDNAQILGLTISLEAPRRAALLAQETRSPVYTNMFKNIQGKKSFETWYPIYRNNRFEGLIAAVYDVEQLLSTIVPPALAKHYAFSIQRTNTGTSRDAAKTVSRELTVPGHGLQLHLQRRDTSHSLIFALSSLGVTALGMALFIGIRAQQRGNRRLAERYRELSEAQDALYKEKERSQITLSSIADGVITLDGYGRILSLNDTAEQQLEVTAARALGQPFTELFPLTIDPDSPNSISSVAELVDQTLHKVPRNQLHGYISRQPEPLYLHCNASRIEIDGAVEGVVVVLHDVSQLTQMASELEYSARHDDLTGLYNRTEFEQRCNQAVRSGQHAMLYMDLDQFKLVNDTCGHLAGDQLLTQLSALLQQKIRTTDTLARLGGDEFGLLLTHCNLEQAHLRADQIRKTVKEFRFVWDEKVFELGCSIGLVPLSPEFGDYNAALARADLACYIAKDSGRNRIHLFTETDQETSRREGEMSWVARLNKALEQNSFLLYQQTIQPVCSDNGQQAFCEMLLRLRDDDGSLIPPGAFLPAAERYHLISLLDQRVIDLALSFFEQNPEALAELGMCSINLSGQSISDPTFIESVCERLEHSSVPNRKICFEVTETAAIANLTKASDFIRQLQAKGVRFALDDFGSGMSSFGYLKQLPVDYLKIDGSFVKDITRDPQDRAFVEAINSVGHSMAMTTVAEFVEDDQILAVLQQIGIDYAQGYGIARPAPLKELLTSPIES